MQNKFAKQEPILLEPISIHTNKRNGAYNMHRPPDTPTFEDITVDVRKLINVHKIIRYWARTHTHPFWVARIADKSKFYDYNSIHAWNHLTVDVRMPSMLLKTFIHKIVGRMNATALHIFQNRIFTNVYRNDSNNSNAQKNMCLIFVNSNLNVFIFLSKQTYQHQSGLASKCFLWTFFLLIRGSNCIENKKLSCWPTLLGSIKEQLKNVV